jgi:O-antigen/teichoic acid export membrane protein
MSFVSRARQQIKASLATFGSADGLKGTVFRGGAWLGAGSMFEQVIRFARNMLLTRLLAPAAFGTMAIVLSATSLIGILAEVGAREALIQNPRGCEDEYVGATFWLSLGRAALIYVTVFLTAPLVSRFYGNLELASLARVATLSVVFDGLMSPRAIVAMKQMRYSKWAIVQNGGGILGVLTTVVLSFFMRDVWALVIGFCSENGARCILSYAVCPYRPRFRVDAHAFRDLTRFSRGLFGLAFLNLIFTRVDIFVLGKLFPASDLGLYSMAVYLVQTPSVFLAAIFVQTLLPALSRIQDDHERMNRILLKVSSATLMLGLPALVFVGFCGRSLLTLIYGPRYSAVAPALVLAAVASFLNLLNVQITLMFYAKGTPHLHRRSVAVMAGVAVILVYPLSKGLGIWAGQLACLLAVIAGYLLQLERIRTVTGLPMKEYGKRFLVPAAISLGIAGLWLTTASIRAFTQPIVNVSFGLVGCLLAYGCAGAIFLRGTMKVQSPTARAANG